MMLACYSSTQLVRRRRQPLHGTPPLALRGDSCRCLSVFSRAWFRYCRSRELDDADSTETPKRGIGKINPVESLRVNGL